VYGSHGLRGQAAVVSFPGEALPTLGLLVFAERRIRPAALSGAETPFGPICAK